MSIPMQVWLYTLITVMGIGFVVLGLEYRKFWAFVLGVLCFISLYTLLLGNL